MYFNEFLSFFFPAIESQINWQKTPISLDKELEQITASSQTEKRYADRLFKVWLLDNQELWILIHIEVQSQYDLEFQERMFIYNYRAYDLYHKPVISLAILGDENKIWRPTSFEYGLGESQVKIKFSIAKLLDYKWEELEQNKNPFAVVVMAHLKTKVTTSNLTEREQWKWNLIRCLYERGYNRKEIVDLFKVIDKMMSLPVQLQQKIKTKLTQYEEERKMPFLSTLEEMALEKGAKETSRNHIIKILEKRFGTLPDELINAINKLDDLPLLERLHLETITVNSVAEFSTLIQENLE